MTPELLPVPPKATPRSVQSTEAGGSLMRGGHAVQAGACLTVAAMGPLCHHRRWDVTLVGTFPHPR